MEEIQNLIKIFDSLNTQQYNLFPPIKHDKLLELEKKYNIHFPKDYAKFISTVGDGGTIKTTFGCNNLVSLSKYEQYGYSLSGVLIPFTLTESWMPDWGDQIESTFNEESEEQLADARWEMIHKYGTITLLENCSDNYQRWFLIVNGPRYGEVWLESEFGVLRFPNCSFSQWLQLILQERWDEYAKQCIALEYTKRNKHTLSEKCLKALEEVHIVPNPPTKLSIVKDFENRHHIQLPKSFVEFYTNIANGGKVKRGEFPKLYSIDELDTLDNMNLPFFIQSENQLKNLVLQVKGTTNGSFSMPWVLLKQYTSLSPREGISPWIHPILASMNGCLPLLARPVSMRQGQLFLILNGAFQGQIWSANQVELIPKVNHKFSNGDSVNVLNFLIAYSQGKY